MFAVGIKSTITGAIYTAPNQSPANNSKVTNLVIAQPVCSNGQTHYEFIECAFWGKDADSVMKYPVGHLMSVDGILTAQAYMNKDNKPAVRYKLTVTVWNSLQSLNSDKQKTESESSHHAVVNQAQVENKQRQKITGPLKDALEFTFTKGKFAGKNVASVLLVEPMFVYNLCVNQKLNQEQRNFFCLAYNYWYKQTQTQPSVSAKQESKSTRIEGVKRNNVQRVPATTSSRDLPF